jgi:cyclopropane fatty-acyl-phospholipid synthase-like methyltransferase
MKEIVENFRSRDYWIVENTLYAEPSFRLKKCAQLINKFATNGSCSLLDVGCGPGALQRLLNPNISYYGIDIAIHNPAPNFKEKDTTHETIGFNDKKFDVVVAMGFFEYMGEHQNRKFGEISRILKDDGIFVMSYINFGHYHRKVWPNYNNVRSISSMTDSLNEVFTVEKCFPASHHWRQKQPGERALRSIQMLVNFNIPILSPLLAVEYFFICSKRG